MEMLIFLGLFGVIVYFMMIRPMRKQADAQKQTQAALVPGARILMQNGMIGTVRAVGDNQLVVELAPGTDVTVLKQIVAKVLTPADEEFEYADSELEAGDLLELEAGEDSELESPEGEPESGDNPPETKTSAETAAEEDKPEK